MKVLRSKKGHNKNKPKKKNGRVSQAQKEESQAKPKVIGMDDPWGIKGRPRGSCSPEKEETSQKRPRQKI